MFFYINLSLSPFIENSLSISVFYSIFFSLPTFLFASFYLSSILPFSLSPSYSLFSTFLFAFSVFLSFTLSICPSLSVSISFHLTPCLILNLFPFFYIYLLLLFLSLPFSVSLFLSPTPSFLQRICSSITSKVHFDSAVPLSLSPSLCLLLLSRFELPFCLDTYRAFLFPLPPTLPLPLFP